MKSQSPKTKVDTKVKTERTGLKRIKPDPQTKLVKKQNVDKRSQKGFAI